MIYFYLDASTYFPHERYPFKFLSQLHFCDLCHQYSSCSLHSQYEQASICQLTNPEITCRLQRPWPLLPLVLAVVPLSHRLQRFSNGSAHFKMKNALALSKMKFQA